MEPAVQNFPTKAGDEVEINFAKVARAIASNDMTQALALKTEAPKAVEAFGDLFLFGYGSQHNHSFESYGDGIFSIQGGNLAQKDVTFKVDTSPNQDGIQWLVLDNTKLPKKSEQVSPSAVSPDFPGKMTGAFGKQAVASIEDSRIQECAGYYFDGLEGLPPSQDWLDGVTPPRLGDQWKMTQAGTYELKNQEMGQILSFNSVTRETTLETYYDVQHFETSRHREILRRDRDGSVTRELPPVGI